METRPEFRWARGGYPSQVSGGDRYVAEVFNQMARQPGVLTDTIDQAHTLYRLCALKVALDGIRAVRSLDHFIGTIAAEADLLDLRRSAAAYAVHIDAVSVQALPVLFGETMTEEEAQGRMMGLFSQS